VSNQSNVYSLMNSEFGIAALEYAKLGWSVFPCCPIRNSCTGCGWADCKSPGKHPLISGGFKNATRDLEQINEWWTRWPDANIGIATGTASGFFALDLDGEPAFRELEKLQAQFGKLPKTMTVKTCKGVHQYYCSVKDTTIRSRGRIDNLPIDVRGEGGYVVGPPSNHKSGSQYSWIHSPQETPLAGAPAGLVDWLTKANEPTMKAINADPNSFTAMTNVPDLSNHPGVSDGARHNVALQLVGRELGRGIAPLEVFRLAWEVWNPKNNPPMDHCELFQIVSDLSNKEAEKLGFGVSSQPEWPQARKEVYHGVLGEMVYMMEPETEADPIAIHLQMMTIFGAMIGRSAHFALGPTREYGNLYATIAGDSAMARKGTSWSWARSAMTLPGCPITIPPIKSGVVSGEAIIWNVRDAEDLDMLGPADKTGKKRDPDKGIEDKRLILHESEFGSLLNVSKRECNTTSAGLRDAWDRGDLQTVAKNSAAKATGAYIAMVGHITIQELCRLITVTDMLNGFANRIIWAAARRTKELAIGRDMPDLTEQQRWLSDAVVLASETFRVQLDTGANKRWVEMYHSLTQTRPGLMGAILARGSTQVLKLALLYALVDKSKTILLPHLEAAYALWKYSEASCGLIFKAVTGDQLADKLLTFARESRRTKTECFQKFSGHCTKSQLDNAIRTLVNQGLAKIEKGVSSGGRPPEYLVAL
jgi:hypothetical protein